MALNPRLPSLRDEGKLHVDTQTRRPHEVGRSRSGACARRGSPRTAAPPPAEEWPGSHSASRPLEGTDPANPLILDFQPLELGHDTFTVFVPHGLRYFIMEPNTSGKSTLICHCLCAAITLHRLHFSHPFCSSNTACYPHLPAFAPVGPCT